MSLKTVREFSSHDWKQKIYHFTNICITFYEHRRHRFESTFNWEDLSLAMKKLGVDTIFDEEKANLTNISDDPLYVSKVQ